MKKKQVPDIDVFAKHFATNINHILDVDYDPRVLRIKRLLKARKYLPEAERQLLVETLKRVAGRAKFWARQLTPMILIILTLAITASAQSFPRWPDNQTVKVFTLTGAFTPDEQGRIKAAVEAWRPLLPAGMTLTIAGEASHVQECQGCVTLNRESVIKSRWAECESHTNDKGLTRWAVIRIDPRAGSGDKFQRRVEHEIGHALGLDHRPDSIMAERPHGKPGEGDAAILRMVYSPTKGEANANISNIASRNDSVRFIQRVPSREILGTLESNETTNTEALKSYQWTLTV